MPLIASMRLLEQRGKAGLRWPDISGEWSRRICAPRKAREIEAGILPGGHVLAWFRSEILPVGDRH
jgi:hypothetical protein